MQSWSFPPIERSSASTLLAIHLPIILRSTSPIPIGLTPGFLSRRISRQLLYGIRVSDSSFWVAIRLAIAATVFLRLSEFFLKQVKILLYCAESKPDGPCAPLVRRTAFSTNAASILSKTAGWKARGCCPVTRHCSFNEDVGGCFERRILKTSLSPILCFNGRTPPFSPASTRIAPETFPSFIISLKRLIGLGSLTFCLAAGFRFCNAPASWKSSVSFPLNQKSRRRLSVLLAELSSAFFVRQSGRWGMIMAASNEKGHLLIGLQEV